MGLAGSGGGAPAGPGSATRHAELLAGGGSGGVCPADVLGHVAVALRCLAMAFGKMHGEVQQEELTNVLSKAEVSTFAGKDAPEEFNLIHPPDGIGKQKDLHVETRSSAN